MTENKEQNNPEDPVEAALKHAPFVVPLVGAALIFIMASIAMIVA